MSESWHGTLELGRGGNSTSPSIDYKQKPVVKSKSQEFECTASEEQSNSVTVIKDQKENLSCRNDETTNSPPTHSSKVTRSISPQCRIIPIVNSNPNKLSPPLPKSLQSNNMTPPAKSVSPPFRILSISCSPECSNASQTFSRNSLSPTNSGVSNERDNEINDNDKNSPQKADSPTTLCHSIITEEILETVVEENTTENDSDKNEEVLSLNEIDKSEHSSTIVSKTSDSDFNKSLSKDTMMSDSLNSTLNKGFHLENKSGSFITSILTEPQFTEDNIDGMSGESTIINLQVTQCSVSSSNKSVHNLMQQHSTNSNNFTVDSRHDEDTKSTTNVCSPTKIESQESHLMPATFQNQCLESLPKHALISKVMSVSDSSHSSDEINRMDDEALMTTSTSKLILANWQDGHSKNNNRSPVVNLPLSNTNRCMNNTTSKGEPASDFRSIVKGTNHPISLPLVNKVVDSTTYGSSKGRTDFIEIGHNKWKGKVGDQTFLCKVRSKVGLQWVSCPVLEPFTKGNECNPNNSCDNGVNGESKQIGNKCCAMRHTLSDPSIVQNLNHSRKATSSRYTSSDVLKIEIPRDRSFSNEVDPLMDLEMYNENAPDVYQSFDLSDGFDSPSPPLNYNRETNGWLSGQAKTKRNIAGNSNSSNFPIADLKGENSKSERENVNSSMCAVKSYTFEDFENLPHIGDVDYRALSYLFHSPILLENVINGYFCPYIAIEPNYFRQGIFQWTRLFNLNMSLFDMKKIEKKLSIFYHKYCDLVFGNAVTAIEERFVHDDEYWYTVDCLKQILNQPTFTNVRQQILGTNELLQYSEKFKLCYSYCGNLRLFLKLDDFRVSEEEFETSREAPSPGNSDLYDNRMNNVWKLNDKSVEGPENSDQAKGELSSTVRRVEEKAKFSVSGVASSSSCCSRPKVDSSPLSPTLKNFSTQNMLSNFLQLCDNGSSSNEPGENSLDDDMCAYESDEEEEEETLKVYIETVAITVRSEVDQQNVEKDTTSVDEMSTVLSLCRTFHGELAYMARLRLSSCNSNPRSQASNTTFDTSACVGIDSHLSFSSWEEIDRLMKKLVPHMSPRLDFQYLLRLYAEFKFFILKTRRRNKRCRGCFFKEFSTSDGSFDRRCCRREEFVFLKLLRDELRYFAYPLRSCLATKSLFLEEHNVAYALTRLLSLSLDTIKTMRRSMRTCSDLENLNSDYSDNGDRSTTKDASSINCVETEAYSGDSGMDRMDMRDKVAFHLMNHRAFRTSSMWHNLQAWMSPSDFLDDPNVLHGNSSLLTHDNCHVTQFGGYEGETIFLRNAMTI